MSISGFRKIHDKQMPTGWHTIKSVLIREIQTASNFHHCVECADALFHARLIGESITQETGPVEHCGQAADTPTIQGTAHE